jgi:hypothetical protein
VAPPGDQHLSQDHRLIGVVGDAASRHAAADRIVERTRRKASKEAKALRDKGTRHVLRRHPERIADGKSEQGPVGAIKGSHLWGVPKFSRSVKCPGCRRLLTYSTIEPDASCAIRRVARNGSPSL